jgi:hypothetical protein
MCAISYPTRSTFDIILLQSVDLKPEYFAPFLPTAVSELIRLLGEADTFESKRRIDHSLNVVIEQAGERVAALHVPFAYYSWTFS